VIGIGTGALPVMNPPYGPDDQALVFGKPLIRLMAA